MASAGGKKGENCRYLKETVSAYGFLTAGRSLVTAGRFLILFDHVLRENSLNA